MSECLLSEEEKYYLVMGVSEDVRVDGRTRLQYRSGLLSVDVVSNSHGSLRVKLAETEIIVASQVTVDEPQPNKPNQGMINFLVDVSPTASPDFEGRGGDALANFICRLLSASFDRSGSIDLTSLCIIPEKKVFVIGVDILVLQCGGNLLDVISMGVKVCLGLTEIPHPVGVRHDLGAPTPVFTKDEFEFSFLDVSSAPVILTLPKVGLYFVVDATLEEESVSKGKLAVGVTPDGQITSLDKIGQGSYQHRSVTASVIMASKVGIMLNKLLGEKIAILKAKKPRREVEKKAKLEVLNEYVYDPMWKSKFEKEKEDRRIAREAKFAQPT